MDLTGPIPVSPAALLLLPGAIQLQTKPISMETAGILSKVNHFCFAALAASFSAFQSVILPHLHKITVSTRSAQMIATLRDVI